MKIQTLLIVAVATAAVFPAFARAAGSETNSPDVAEFKAGSPTAGADREAGRPAWLSLADVPDNKVADLSALHREMRHILRSERELLVPLNAEFATEMDPLLALDIQKRIQALKIETELSLMRTQAVHARREGRLESAERIEAILDDMATGNAANKAIAPASPRQVPADVPASR